MKTILKKVGGWTPMIDQLVLNPKYGAKGAAVFGVVWRHCQMKDGVCKASLDRMGELIEISTRATIIKYLKRLVKDGYLIDITPGLKNRPHIYKDAGKFDMVISLEIESSDPETGVDLLDTSTGVQPLNTSDNDKSGVQVGVQVGVQPLNMSTLNTLKEDKEKNRHTPHVSPSFSENENSGESKEEGDYLKNKNIHPTIRAFKEITGYYPKKTTWDLLIRTFPEGIIDEVYAKDCFTHWVGKGYNPENLDWLLDWYKTHKYYQHPKEKLRWEDLLHPAEVAELHPGELVNSIVDDEDKPEDIFIKKAVNSTGNLSPATISAWEDWEKIKIVANDHGLKDLAEKLQPPAEAGWRDIDKSISELKNVIQNVAKLSAL